MEHFLDLLEERLSVELRGGDEGVLAEQNVLAAQRRIKVLV